MPDLATLLEQKTRHLALLWAEARRLAVVLRSLGARDVYVFGSLAKGTAGADSDLDLLIIAPSDSPPPERSVPYQQAVAAARPRVPVDLLVFTPEEASSPRRSRSLARLLEEGIRL